MEIRHNFVLSEKPFFRRGRCVLKAAHHVEKRKDQEFFGCDERGSVCADWYGSMHGRVHADVAACAQFRRCAGGAGRPGRTADLQLDSALRNNPRYCRDKYRARAGRGRCRSCGELCRSRQAKKHRRQRRVVGPGARCGHRGQFGVAFRQRVCQRAFHRQRRRCREHVGHGGRRSFVFGDIRDVVREGKHLAMGEDTDRLVLGLAAAGLAITAATYVSFGGVAPVRAGLTLVKDARKVGRLGEGLTRWAGRSAREMVDTPMLENAVASARCCGRARPSMRSRRHFIPKRPAALVRLAKDVGRVGEKAGVRGALDTLGSPKVRRTSRARRGSPSPRAARPARSSKCSAAARCCWRPAPST